MAKNDPIVFRTNRGARIIIDPRYADPRNTSAFNEVLVSNKGHDPAVAPLEIEQYNPLSKWRK